MSAKAILDRAACRWLRARNPHGICLTSAGAVRLQHPDAKPAIALTPATAKRSHQDVDSSVVVQPGEAGT